MKIAIVGTGYVGLPNAILLAQHNPEVALDVVAAKDIEVLEYEPALDTDSFYHSRVMRDLAEFKEISDVIIANHHTSALKDATPKLYTRDLFDGD